MKVTSFLLLFAPVVLASILAENFYERLGVKKDDTARDIRIAFKKLALTMHPDKNPGDSNAHAKMVELNMALTVLTDPEKRKEYDSRGVAGPVHHGDAHQPFNFYQSFGIYDDEPAVEVLDYLTWEADHGNLDAWFVIFYSSHCTKCDDVAPAWKRAAQTLRDVVHFGACNCDRAFPVCRQLGISALPTMLFFQKGQHRGLQVPHPYDGAQEVNSMISWVRSKIKTLSLDLQTSEFIPNSPLPFGGTKGPLWIVGFCTDAPGCTALAGAIHDISVIVDDLVPVGTFHCEMDTRTCKEHGIVADPPIIVLYDHAEHQNFPVTTLAAEIAHKALKKLGKLPVMDIDTLESVAEVALHPEKHVSHTKRGNEKEYLILFASQDRCEDDDGLGTGSSACYKALFSLRKVMKTLQNDWEYGELVITTFSCDLEDQSLDRRREKLCQGLGAGNGKPLLIHMDDKGLNPNKFHDRIDRPNQVLGFVTEVFRSVVHEITHADFETHVVKEQQTWYIDFYAPWCHHCRDVWPEWNLASKKIAEIPTEIHFGKVDCAVHADVCNEHHIRGFPSFLLFHKGVRHQFDFDHRTAEEFVRFAKQELEPTVVEFDVDLYKKIIFNPDVPMIAPAGGQTRGDKWVVNFFAPWCSHCHVMAPKYLEAATALRGVVKFGKFNCELDAPFCARLGVSRFPTIWRFDTGLDCSKPKAEYPGEPDPAHILKFAVEDVDNVLVDLNINTFKEFVRTDPETSWVLLFFSSRDSECKDCHEVELRVKALAARFLQKQADQAATGRQDPVAHARPINVHFGRFDCRESGPSYAFCIGEKVKKFPSLLYYSGATGDQSKLSHDNTLELLSQVDRKIDQDRRELLSPFRGDPGSWRYRHNEL